MRFITQLWLIAILSFLGVAQSQAQSSSPSTDPYLLLKVGYGMPDSQQQVGAYANIPTSGGMYRGIYGSYAQGMNLTLGIGKMLNPTFGFEGSAQLVLGKTISGSYDYPTISGTSAERTRSVILKPMIVIRNSGDLLTIYSKLGLAVAVISKIYKHDEFYKHDDVRDPKNDQVSLAESSETASVKVGFAAGFGLAFRVTECFSVLVEVDGQLLSLPIRKGRLTRYEQNGADKLASLSVSEKSWVYENSVPVETSPNTSEPEKRLFNPKYYSYAGVGLGIIYHF